MFWKSRSLYRSYALIFDDLLFIKGKFSKQMTYKLGSPERVYGCAGQLRRLYRVVFQRWSSMVVAAFMALASTQDHLSDPIATIIGLATFSSVTSLNKELLSNLPQSSASAQYSTAETSSLLASKCCGI